MTTRPREAYDSQRPGILYIVATPIGNLEDITFRAVRILKSVNLIAAEDTRQTKKLLHAYGIETPLTSLFDHNEAAKSGYLIRKIAAGQDLAYVSDAGTPGISDPGYILINEAIAQGIRIVPVPGVSAAVAALCASGLPMDRFIFNGFLPQKRDKRRAMLISLREEMRTSVFYESPKRLPESLRDMSDILGNRPVVVARELTKIFEEIIRGPLSDVAAALSQRVVKGEITVIVAGRGKVPAPDAEKDIQSRIAMLKESENLSVKDMAVRLADEFGMSRRAVYQQLVKADR
jgi:16S rRNA (cytidine1402-2'-O)-methyltransferase